MECPTDPTNPDTDGDGLSDFDELSADQVAKLESFNGVFAGYHFDASSSKKYGTDPLNPDTDGDTLSDRKELLEPYYLSVPGESAVRAVFTNPLDPDTDHDDLTDSQEETGKLDNSGCTASGTPLKCCTGAHAGTCSGTFGPTDPTDPDTDGDKRLDGSEVDQGTNPLVKDIRVTVTFTEFRITNGPTDYNQELWRWFFYVQKPTDAFPGQALSSAPLSVQTVAGKQECFGLSDYLPNCGSLDVCHLANREDVYFGNGAEVSFPLRAGQGFVVNGSLDDFKACIPPTILCSETMKFSEAYTYENLTGFVAQDETLTAAPCSAVVSYQITTE
jgi:hypothetical protein